MNKTQLSVTICAMLAFAPSVLAQTVLKIGYTTTNDSHYGTAANVFGTELEKRTSGRYKLEQYPSAALGGEREMIEAVKQGKQDMVVTSTGPIGDFVPEARIFDIPFLFRGYDHAHKVLDGAIGQEILAKIPAQGMFPLGWLENGFRQITNNRQAINVPEDLKGLKIRTMENRVHVEAFKAMGALPTPMPMPDLLKALPQGTVDGQENPIPVILSNQLYTMQKHLTMTGHVYSPALLLISPRAWSRVSDADKKAFLEAAKAAAEANRKRVGSDEANGLATIKGAGVAVVQKIDMAKFQTAVAPAYVSYAKEFGAERIRRIQDFK